MQQIYFGARIASYRKEKELTQEALAQRLGVTNQAVSKWESDQCCPDIMLLPEHMSANALLQAVGALYTKAEFYALVRDLP